MFCTESDSSFKFSFFCLCGVPKNAFSIVCAHPMHFPPFLVHCHERALCLQVAYFLPNSSHPDRDVFILLCDIAFLGLKWVHEQNYLQNIPCVPLEGEYCQCLRPPMNGEAFALLIFSLLCARGTHSSFRLFFFCIQSLFRLCMRREGGKVVLTTALRFLMSSHPLKVLRVVYSIKKKRAFTPQGEWVRHPFFHFPHSVLDIFFFCLKKYCQLGGGGSKQSSQLWPIIGCVPPPFALRCNPLGCLCTPSVARRVHCDIHPNR